MVGWSIMRTAAGVAGVAAIIVFGVIFWALLATLFGATKEAGSSLSPRGSSGWLVAETESTPGGSRTSAPATSEAAVAAVPTQAPTPLPSPVATRAAEPTVAPTPAPSPTALAAEERNPWVLLPRPDPNSKVQAGPIVVEARARGDAPIKEIQIELDGSPLPVKMEQRSDTIWRAFAQVGVQPGQRSARAVVVDTDGRRGSYRWSFEVVAP